MAFELPSFTEMKGHAVSVMNFFCHEKKLPAPVPVQFPIELRTIHGYQVFLINKTSGLICKRGIPKELVRPEEAQQPHNEDAWAFVLVNIERDPKKLEIQRLMFPQFSPYVSAFEVFTDWQTAVQHAVLHAASCAWTREVLFKDTGDESEELNEG